MPGFVPPAPTRWTTDFLSKKYVQAVCGIKLSRKLIELWRTRKAAFPDYTQHAMVQNTQHEAEPQERAQPTLGNEVRAQTPYHTLDYGLFIKKIRAGCMWYKVVT